MSTPEPQSSVTRLPIKRRRRASGGVTLAELGRRMDDVETVLDEIRTHFGRLEKVGILLAGAFIASGFIDGKAVTVLKAIIGAP